MDKDKKDALILAGTAGVVGAFIGAAVHHLITDHNVSDGEGPSFQLPTDSDLTPTPTSARRLTPPALSTPTPTPTPTLHPTEIPNYYESSPFNGATIITDLVTKYPTDEGEMRDSEGSEIIDDRITMFELKNFSMSSTITDSNGITWVLISAEQLSGVYTATNTVDNELTGAIKGHFTLPVNAPKKTIATNVQIAIPMGTICNTESDISSYIQRHTNQDTGTVYINVDYKQETDSNNKDMLPIFLSGKDWGILEYCVGADKGSSSEVVESSAIERILSYWDAYTQLDYKEKVALTGKIDPRQLGTIMNTLSSYRNLGPPEVYHDIFEYFAALNDHWTNCVVAAERAIEHRSRSTQGHSQGDVVRTAKALYRKGLPIVLGTRS